MARKSTRRRRPKDPSDYRKVLRKIRPVDEFKPETNAAFYGKAGTGKTTLASTGPKKILFLDMKEKGTDSIRKTKGIDVIRVTDWPEIEHIYYYLRDHKHEYKTVVWDTVSQAQQLCIKSYLEEKGKQVDEIGKWGTMSRRDWGSISSKMKEWITNYRDLPMVVIFIAHDRVFNVDEEDQDDEGRLLPEVGPNLMPSVASTMNASVSIIGNTFVRERYERVKTKKRGQYKEKRHVDYCLRVGPHSIYTTKIRKPKETVLPDVIEDPTYDKLVAYITGDWKHGKVEKGKQREKGKKRKLKL